MAGLTFVLTGVYESLERDEVSDLIKELGGKVTTSLSKKTSYMVSGEESGPAKLAKAEDLGTKVLTEDDLLNLIREKSGLPLVTPKPAKKDSRDKADADEKDERKIKKEKDSPVKKVKRDLGQSSKKNIAMSQEAVTMVDKKENGIKQENDGSFNCKKLEDNLLTYDNFFLVKIKPEFERKVQDKSEVSQAWVDKYKPQSFKEIIGQQGPSSNTEKYVTFDLWENWDSLLVGYKNKLLLLHNSKIILLFIFQAGKMANELAKEQQRK